LLLYYSEGVGWVPMWGECPDEHIEDYIEAYGLLMEDLEVMHGAYREDNHNCKLYILFSGDRTWVTVVQLKSDTSGTHTNNCTQFYTVNYLK